MPGSTKYQILMKGFALAKFGAEFDSPEQEENAWYIHRDELMEQCAPGMRPAAFFKFECGLSRYPDSPVRDFYRSVGALQSRNLLRDDELVSIESGDSDFRAVQSPIPFDTFGDLVARAKGSESQTDRDFELIANAPKGYLRLCAERNQLSIIAAFHRWRSRASLATYYQTRAECVDRELHARKLAGEEDRLIRFMGREVATGHLQHAAKWLHA
jgi:hypothetical protein